MLLMLNRDRDVRRTAWESYRDGYLAFKNTFANNLTAALKGDVFIARARRHPTSLDAALFPNNIPTAVFHNLVATFRENLPTWHRYWALRRKALGVDELHPYDVLSPLSTISLNIPFEQAVDWISDGLRPLGEDYVEVMRRGCLEDRWVDRYPNVGKRQGAFSSGAKFRKGGTVRGLGATLGWRGSSIAAYMPVSIFWLRSMISWRLSRASFSTSVA